MKTIDFVVRTGAGAVERGMVSADGSATPIAAGADREISLNLRQSDVRGYQRLGSNLEITLADGRVVILEDFFDANGDETSRLFISADGYLNEVVLVEGQDGAVFAQYGPTEQWGKWSPSDDLIFLDGTEVAHVETVADDEVSMLGAGALSGLGLWGAGGAVVGGTVLLTDRDGDHHVRIEPSIDQDQTITIAGDDVTDDDQSILISGKADPGSEVEVTVGGETLTTTADDDGTWRVVFEDDSFPGDGDHDVTVKVTEGDGLVTDLIGPDVVIDLTGPLIDFTDGTESVGDLTNLVDHADGVEIAGTGEPGASIEVTIDGVTHVTTVGTDGSWAVVFANTEVVGGEYETTVTVVSTDIHGNSTTVTDNVIIDTVPDPIVINEATIEGDGVVNATEASDGVEITGTSTPGIELTVEIEGVSQTVTVGADGTWVAVFDPKDLPGGEYDSVITATTTDAAGNSNTVTGTVHIDLVTNVAFDATTIEGDNVVNTAEMADGITLTGTAEPGASVVVSYGNVSHAATVAADGSWTVDFAAGDFVAGDYDAEFTVTATDTAGNTASDSRTIRIDTEANVAIDDGQAGGDDLINAAEQATGVTLTGTADPGSSVEVTLGGVTHSATVASDGSWTASFASSEIAAGEYDATVTAVATDAAGNTSTASDTIRVDTVTSVAFDATTVEGDNVVNTAEMADGVTLTGTAEPGASVVVSYGSLSHAATVAADGSWTVDFAAGDFAAGDYDAEFTAVATDAAGNTSTASDTIRVDTVNTVTFNAANIEGEGVVNAVEHADGVTLTGTTQPGSTVTVQMGAVTHTALVDASGNWSSTFLAGEIPTGEYDANVTVSSVDAAGNSAQTTGTVEIDTLVRDFALGSMPGGSDGIVNADEASHGMVITGQTEPGSSVIVQLGMVQHVATVATDGSWSVNFAATEIPQGEYTTTLTATATDRAGNVETLSDTVEIDTLAGSLTLSRDPIEGDNIINAVEASDGVDVHGTSDPGNVVQVTLAGVTHSVVTASDGTWTAHYAATEIAQGTYTADITATTVDPAGNSRTVTGTVDVDTEVLNLGFDTAPVETDDVVNAVERADGVTINGTVEPGSRVEVTLGGVTHSALVDAAGNWSADFSAGEIPSGEYNAAVQVDVVDRAGNTDSLNKTVRVDTLVNTLATSTAPIEGDGVVNAAEAADGVTLSGVVERGSSVEVEFGGTRYAATVDASGNWSVDIPASAIAAGDYSADAVIHATDSAGNTASISQTITVDTVAPDGPDVASYTRDHTGIRGISIETTSDEVSIMQVHDDNSITDVTATGVDIPVLGETTYAFSSTVPDGSHLVVTSTDDAGNTSGTYLVLDETLTSVVGMSNPNLGDLQIEAIDLTFAEDSQLTITEAQLVALSSNSDSVVIHGGSDDTVTITGAVRTGTSMDVDGQTHDVYTLGTDGTLIIDDDIHVVI